MMTSKKRRNAFHIEVQPDVLAVIDNNLLKSEALMCSRASDNDGQY